MGGGCGGVGVAVDTTAGFNGLPIWVLEEGCDFDHGIQSRRQSAADMAVFGSDAAFDVEDFDLGVVDDDLEFLAVARRALAFAGDGVDPGGEFVDGGTEEGL